MIFPVSPHYSAAIARQYEKNMSRYPSVREEVDAFLQGRNENFTKAISSKRELGANYGMVNYGGAAKEWFEQADAFNALCVGKTATEIKALCAADNYGTEEVKTAGCTILVNGLTKAAAKIG